MKQEQSPMLTTILQAGVATIELAQDIGKVFLTIFGFYFVYTLIGGAWWVTLCVAPLVMYFTYYAANVWTQLMYGGDDDDDESDDDDKKK